MKFDQTILKVMYAEDPSKALTFDLSVALFVNVMLSLGKGDMPIIFVVDAVADISAYCVVR